MMPAPFLTCLRKHLLSGPYDCYLWLLIPLAAASLWVGYDWRLGVPTILALSGGAALYFFVSRSAVEPRRWHRAAVLLVGGGGLVGLFFLLQLVFHYSARIPALSFLSSVPIAPPGFDWKPYSNSIAMFLEGIFFAGIAAACITPTRWLRLALGAVTALIGVAIGLTISRGAWMGVFFAGIIWASRYWRVARWILLVLAASLCALVGYVLVEGSLDAITKIPLVSGILTSLFFRPERLELYQNSLALIADMPFTGIGIGDQFALVYSRYELGLSYLYLGYAHNLWLETWLEMGLLGLVGLNLLIVSIYRRALLTSRHPERIRFESGWVGMTAIFIHSLFDACMYDSLWVWLPIFYVLGLNAALHIQYPAPRSRWWGWIQAGVVIAILSGLAIWFYPLPARWYANAGSLAQQRADLSPALSPAQRASLLTEAEHFFQKALRLQPDMRSANQRLGLIALDRRMFEKAAAYLETAHQAEPDHYATQKFLGLACMYLGKLDRAEMMLRPTLAIRDEINTLGWQNLQNGDAGAAINSFRLSLRLFPNQPEIQNQLRYLEAKKTTP